MNAWLRTGRLLFGIAWEIGPVVVLSYVGVSVIAAVSPLLLAVGLRPLVDGVTTDRADQVMGGAVLCAVGLALTALAPVCYRWTTIRLRERSIMVMERRMLTLAGGAPRVEHLEVPAFWDRLRLLERSTQDLALGMSLAVIGPILLVELAVTAVLLGRLQPVLLLVPVIALPAAWLSQRAEALRRAADLRTAEGRRVAEHLLTLASTAGPATEVRVYGLHHELLDRHRQVSRDVHRGMETGHFLAVAVNAGGWLLFAVTYVGALFLVLREAAGGRATAGDVALTLGLAAAVVLAAGRLSDLAGSLLRTRTASEHYHWLEGQASPSGTGSEPEPPPAQLRQGVDLDRVSFRYPGSDRSVLSDVSLRLPAGGVVAVVGENGAGKTTLVKLLCGMYAPTEGRILLDDIDLADIDIEAYRKRLTAGFQDFMRFELAIREAVGVGDLPRMDDEDAVRDALAKANAGFTERLPSGVETQLGLSWQGGVDLSGGEWQKVALARSMLRTDPLLMVLDEPTAALDPHTEHALFEQVAAGARDARSGRVTLLISHRFSTVRMADLIVVLDQGRVVEQGSHEDLVGQDGLYAELYHLQAKAYQQS
ncbi:ABC transporter ATP-binding protein [Actinopolymorpha sp. B11F2]|uniref:ABC transporter ATP-binding protein n=1 Tax=Actinopolymorpha sp. B11F2 TaxID=3160862 RepID=UPI0032E3E05E